MVRCPGGLALIDIGIGPRSAAGRMAGTGVLPDQIRAICLTHLDRDHFNPNWLRTIRKQGIALYCHQSCARAIRSQTRSGELGSLLHPFDGAGFEPLEGLHFHPIALEHDQSGSHGFVVEGFGARIGYATDLGRVPDRLLECFCDLDVLGLESNYDPQMQLNSNRPWFLKERIMSGQGHLSNQQAFDAICAILDRCQKIGARLPAHIVLLHRSRECNCPRRMRELFRRDPRIAPRLLIAEQSSRTGWLGARRTAARSLVRATG